MASTTSQGRIIEKEAAKDFPQNALWIQKLIVSLQRETNIIVMTVETWEKLPVEERKKLIEKRKAAAKKYQGSLTILNQVLL